VAPTLSGGPLRQTQYWAGPFLFFSAAQLFSRASPPVQIQISRINEICNLMPSLKFNRDKSTGPKFTNFIFLETLGNYLHYATGYNPKSIVELK
jgi:hypothetical protein